MTGAAKPGTTKVGLLTLGDWLADPATGQRSTEAERHRQLVEQAVRAEAAGFDAVHLGEHHFSDYILSSPAIVLAAIAERTERIRLSNGVALAANLDPVRIAEDYATVDVLSGGRVDPCFGRGNAYPDVYTFFGQSPAEASDRFAENVRLVSALWNSDGPIDWDGQFRAPLRGVEVHPRPMQSPPPMWIGGGLSPASVDLAVELGAGLMLPTVFGTWDMFVPAVERYIERWEASAWPEAQRRIGCCSHAFVGTDHEAVRADWSPRYLHYLESVNDWISQSAQRAGLPPAVLPAADFEQLTKTIAICGSPNHVVDRMGAAAEMLHLDTHLLMFDMGGVSDGDLFNAIDLVGAAVIPQL